MQKYSADTVGGGPSGPAKPTINPGPGLLDRLVLTFQLAGRDLKDEKLLSICLISAIAAVMAPIMVLAAMKFGFIDIMRSRLVNDPNFRLIVPTASQIRPPSFFERLRKRPDVIFIQPTVNLSGTPVRVGKEKSRRLRPFDLVPTSLGDPLIMENAGKIPQEGEATLSRPGAENLGVQVGDTIKMSISRSGLRRREKVSVLLKVAAVLDVAADRRRTIYVNEQLATDVDRYRLGIPVTERKWSGMSRAPQQTFDAVYVVLAEQMSEVDLNEIRVGGGFAQSTIIEPAKIEGLIGKLAVPAAQTVLLANRGKSVSGHQIENLAGKLGNRGFWLLPVVKNMRASVAGDGDKLIEISTFSPKMITDPPQGAAGWLPWRANMSYSLGDRILIPKSLAERRGLKAGGRLNLDIKPATKDDASKNLKISAAVDGIVDGDKILMHPSLAGMLHAARISQIKYDEGLNTLIAVDPGSRGFRLYGKTIDDIPTLARMLEKEGVDVRAKVDTIEQLQRLDSALTQITLIVGAVAIIGGFAVLIASLYAAVERKKTELSLLRLLGLSRASIFSIPIQQGLMFASLGFLLAWGLYAVFAHVINTQYAVNLPIQGEICKLQLYHLASFFLLTVAIAGISSLFAAGRAMRIDPAEALRKE